MNLKKIIKFEIKINSLQEEGSLLFTPLLLDWNSEGMKIFLNFSNPILVSTGS